MKTTLLAALLGGVCLLATGCNDPSDETIAPSPSHTTPPVAEESQPTPDNGYDLNDQIFLDQMETQGLLTDNPDDAIALGHSVCFAAKQGNTFEALVQVAVEEGLTPYESGWLVGTSVASYCPEEKSNLMSDFDTPNPYTQTW